ncbi:unnamed protein product [Sphagnum balticum]
MGGGDVVGVGGEFYSCSSQCDDGGADGGEGDVPRGVRRLIQMGSVLWVGGRRPWAGLAKLGCEVWERWSWRG